MTGLLEKVAGYSKTERITRLIEIHCKGNNASCSEFIEMQMIQTIREENGEIAEVKKYREWSDRVHGSE